MRINSIITENDFIAYAPPATKVAESPTLVADSYAWNDTLKAIHVNDASASKLGAFRTPIGFLKVGDVVTISAEFKNISGAKARLALDYSLTAAAGFGSGTYLTYPSLNNGEGFEKVEIKYTIVKDAYYSAIFGALTADISEYYMRNCVVKCESIYNPTPKKYKKGFRVYNIQAAYGVYTVSSDHSFDTATFVIDSVNKRLTLTHGIAFASIKAGLPFVQEDSANTSKDYIVRTRSASTVGCIIEIYDRATNTLQDPALIPGIIWFSMFFVGYDNEFDLI